jgi:hypothetical protein
MNISNPLAELRGLLEHVRAELGAKRAEVKRLTHGKVDLLDAYISQATIDRLLDDIGDLTAAEALEAIEELRGLPCLFWYFLARGDQ